MQSDLTDNTGGSSLSEPLSISGLEMVLYNYNFVTNKYDYISSQIKDLTGYIKEELDEIGFDSIIVQKADEVVSPPNGSEEKIQSSVSEFISKYLIKTKNGEEKWIENRALNLLDKKGNLLECVGVLFDITKLDKAVDNLLTEKNKTLSLLDIAAVIFVVIDCNGNLVLINEYGSKLLGYNKNEIMGKNWIEEFVPGERREYTRELHRQIINGEEKSTYNSNLIVTKNKEIRAIDWHNSVLKDSAGNVEFIISAGLDVTETKKEERVNKVVFKILNEANSITNIKDLLKFIHNSISELMLAENFYIALHNSETNMISFPYFVDKFDEPYPPKKFGKGLTEYVMRTGKSQLINAEEDRELLMKGETDLVGEPAAIWLGVPLKVLDKTIGAMVVQDYENENTYGEKEKEILEAVSFPISRAIEKQILQEERERLIEELRESNNSKAKLFSIISHDLRSPFNSLLGFSEILSTEYETLTTDEIKEYLNVIYESSKNLFSMTNNLLQYSRFQMGKFSYEPEKYNLLGILNKAYNLLKGNAIKKLIKIDINIPEDYEVFADEDMISSVFQNLLSNAIKFTNRGGNITVSAEPVKVEEKDFYQIKVKDSGVGIPPNEVNKIFKDVVSSTPGTEKEFGSGLGLLLVREFVEQNGGRISVESKLEEGTTFTFTVPAAQ